MSSYVRPRFLYRNIFNDSLIIHEGVIQHMQVLNVFTYKRFSEFLTKSQSLRQPMVLPTALSKFHPLMKAVRCG